MSKDVDIWSGDLWSGDLWSGDLSGRRGFLRLRR
jgi:hypothetical protein